MSRRAAWVLPIIVLLYAGMVLECARIEAEDARIIHNLTVCEGCVLANYYHLPWPDASAADRG